MSDEKVLKDLLKDKEVGITAKKGTVDEIICIIDRSGSMGSIRKDAEGGFNSFIEDQKKVGEANLTIVEFDDRIEFLHEQVNIQDVEPYVLRPRGMTALLDAIGSVISESEKYTTDKGKTIVVVITDGGENSSKEWKRQAVFKMIEERKEAGWEFMFLAGGQDAIQVGASYGFDSDSTVSFANTAAGAAHAHETMSVYSTNIRGVGKAQALKAKSAYVDQHLDVLSETGEVGNEKDK